MKFLIILPFFLLMNCSTYVIVNTKAFSNPKDAVLYARDVMIGCDSVKVDTLSDNNLRVTKVR